MKLKAFIFENVDKASAWMKDLFVKNIRNNPHIVIGLATGTSPLKFYDMLVQDYVKNKTDWSKVVTFNLDEFVNLDPAHPSAFKAQMQRNLFKHLNLSKNNIHLPNGNCQDLAQAAREYDELLKRYPIELQFISLGANGHMAYNEPPCDPNSFCHVVDLLPTTRQDLQTQGFFQHLDEVPKKAITMGIQSILNCQKIVMAVFGAHKQDIAAKMLNQNPNPKIPASYLQNHHNCTFIFDKAAAAKLDKNRINIVRMED